jgi:hypothetical protein
VAEGPFRMIGTILEANPFLGRIITGRIHSGSIKPNQTVKVLNGEGKLVENGRISKILAFRGLERQPVEEAMPATSSPLPACRRARSPIPSATRRYRAADRTADRSADRDHDLPGQ